MPIFNFMILLMCLMQLALTPSAATARDIAGIEADMKAVGLEIDQWTRTRVASEAELKSLAALNEKYRSYVARLAEIDKKIAATKVEQSKMVHDSGKAQYDPIINQFEQDKVLLRQFKHRAMDANRKWTIVEDEPPGGIEFGYERLTNFEQLEAKVNETAHVAQELEANRRNADEKLKELEAMYAALEEERGELRRSLGIGDKKEDEKRREELAPYEPPPAPPVASNEAGKPAPLDPASLLGEWKLDLTETTVRIYAAGTTSNGDTLLEGRFGNQDLENYDPSIVQDAILFKNVVRVRNKPGQPDNEEEYAGQIWLKESRTSGHWALVYIRLRDKNRMFARDQAGSDAFGFTKVR